MERRLRRADQRTEEFLIAAFQSGAHERVLSQSASNRRLRWSLEAVAAYYQEDWSYSKVGKEINPPTNHETARQLVEKGMTAIWRESSDEVKTKFPFHEIPIKKPYQRAPGQVTLAIRQAALEGRGFDDIATITGADHDQIMRRRGTLKQEGVKVPYKHYSPEAYSHIIELASDPSRPREEYLKIAGTLSRTTVENLALRHQAFVSVVDAVYSSGYFIGAPKIAPVREILQAAGLVLHFEKHIKSGKNAGLIQHYYYVASRDLDLVEDVLKQHKELEIFKENLVKKVAGPDKDIRVSTNDLFKNPDFSPLTDLLMRHNLASAARRPIVDYEILLEGCPAPVYSYGARVIYPTRDVEILDIFFEKKRQELGV